MSHIMPRLYESLLEFFRADNWPISEIPDANAIQAFFQGQNGQWMCFAQAREEQGQIVFYSLCPIKVPEQLRQSVSEFVTRVNYGLIIGNFELDFEDGEVRYKTSIDVEESELSATLIRPLIYPNVWTMDQYLPGLLAVIYGSASPVEAVRQVESDAAEAP